MSDVSNSLPRALGVVNYYRKLSGYKIIWGNLYLCLLMNVQRLSPPNGPILISPSGFTCLGIKIQPSLNGTHEENFLGMLKTT
uniref:Uncharacterized protein n=1 Tax=Anguilla anguilla TaxID=7936 RepID=A0A0E9R8R2_ANGAN